MAWLGHASFWLLTRTASDRAIAGLRSPGGTPPSVAAIISSEALPRAQQHAAPDTATREALFPGLAARERDLQLVPHPVCGEKEGQVQWSK